MTTKKISIIVGTKRPRAIAPGKYWLDVGDKTLAAHNNVPQLRKALDAPRAGAKPGGRMFGVPQPLDANTRLIVVGESDDNRGVNHVPIPASILLANPKARPWVQGDQLAALEAEHKIRMDSGFLYKGKRVRTNAADREAFAAFQNLESGSAADWDANEVWLAATPNHDDVHMAKESHLKPFKRDWGRHINAHNKARLRIRSDLLAGKAVDVAADSRWPSTSLYALDATAAENGSV